MLRGLTDRLSHRLLESCSVTAGMLRHNDLVDETLNEWSEWWVPGSPDERAAGELQFDTSEGPRLTLFAPLPGVRAVQFRAPTLIGETFDGTPLTLLQPVVLQETTNIGGGEHGRVRTRLRGQTLLHGGHAESHDAIVVDRARVRLSGLRELCLQPWPGPGGDLVHFLGSGSAQRVEVAGGSLTFLHSTWGSKSRFKQSSEEDVEILIEVSGPLPLTEFEEQWIRPLEALVIFASRAPTSLQGFTILVSDPDAAAAVHPAIRHGSNPEIWNETHVDVLTETPGLSAEPPSEYKHLLVPFAALADKSHEFIANWWDLYGELGSAAIFLIGALGSRMFLENKLLTEMSFLESYHRIKHGKPEIPAEDHDRNVQAMLATVEDKSQRDHYKQKLRYAAEQNARQRAKALIHRASESLLDVPRLDSQLANQLIDTRNALTHFDPSGTPPLAGADLFYAVARLELVIRVNLLLDLSLDAATIGELIKTSYSNQVPLLAFPESYNEEQAGNQASR